VTADSAPGASTRDVDAVVDAVLLSSRALVAVSARSIAAAKGVTLPQFRMLVVLSEVSTNLTARSRARWMSCPRPRCGWSTDSRPPD